MNSVRSIKLSLKFTPSEFKVLGIGKFEFVKKARTNTFFVLTKNSGMRLYQYNEDDFFIRIYCFFRITSLQVIKDKLFI